jgi:hypothetical protein
MKRITIILLIAFGLFSCQKEEQTTKVIQLSPFSEVKLNSTFEVSLQEDSIFYIELIGDEKLIDFVEYKVEGEVLTLSNSKKYKWLQPTKNKTRIIIHSLPLSEVEANEACTITTVNPITSAEFGLVVGGKLNEAKLELNCTVFYFWNNFPCGGKLELYGKTDQVKLWTDALYVVDAKNLKASYGNIINRSIGDIDVQVNDRLDYSIHNKGNINLYGSPSEFNEIEESTSSGKLVRY